VPAIGPLPPATGDDSHPCLQLRPVAASRACRRRLPNPGARPLRPSLMCTWMVPAGPPATALQRLSEIGRDHLLVIQHAGSRAEGLHMQVGAASGQLVYRSAMAGAAIRRVPAKRSGEFARSLGTSQIENLIYDGSKMKRGRVDLESAQLGGSVVVNIAVTGVSRLVGPA
jgi:hypothetical protein